MAETRANPDTARLEMDVDAWHALASTGARVAVTVTPKGSSMRPLIVGGRDSVLIYPISGPLRKGDIVLFRRKDGANVMHRVWKLDDKSVTTFGDGCARPDAPISYDQVWGVATELYRKGRTYRLDTAVSRFQGRLWRIIRPVLHFPRAAAHKVIREWLGITKKTKQKG